MVLPRVLLAACFGLRLLRSSVPKDRPSELQWYVSCVACIIQYMDACLFGGVNPKAWRSFTRLHVSNLT